MKTTKVIVATLLLLFSSACSGGSGLEVSFDGKKVSVEPKSATVMVDTVSDSVMHTFVIANYDLGEKITKMSLQGSAKQPEQKRVQFTIIGAKGTDESTPIKVGEYPARVGNTGSPANTSNGGRLNFGEDGREQSKSVILSDMKPGSIKITSVTGDKVDGEINITDGKTAIKGKFSVNL